MDFDFKKVRQAAMNTIGAGVALAGVMGTEVSRAEACGSAPAQLTYQQITDILQTEAARLTKETGVKYTVHSIVRCLTQDPALLMLSPENNDPKLPTYKGDEVIARAMRPHTKGKTEFQPKAGAWTTTVTKSAPTR